MRIDFEGKDSGERRMWLASIGLYAQDCASHLAGRNDPNLEFLLAWRDLNGTRRILRKLCEPVGLEAELIGELLSKSLIISLSKRPK